jgi:hypothetical protein
MANDDLSHLQAIFDLVGSPSETTWEGFRDLPYAKHITFVGGTRRKIDKLFRSYRGVCFDLSPERLKENQAITDG